MKKTILTISTLATFFLNAQENANEIKLDDVIVLGNKTTQRTKMTTPVAVDVISIKKIQQSAPQINTTELLNYLVPSFNSTKQSASDGTEHIDPASLRGLGPDQVLVLINGKRRHTTSLINYQNTVGNGSVGIDLSSIPVASIDRIEVLRDGASAQYGSDAIAGVINIILRKNKEISSSITYGMTSRNDGQTFQADVNYGTLIAKNKGFINATINFSNKEETNRTQNHNLDIFGENFAYDFAENPQQARLDDDKIIAERGLTRDDFNFQVGDAKIKNTQLFINSEYNINDKLNFYTFGGFNYKQGEGFGFRRLPSETSNVVLSLFPNGFQPILSSDIYDISHSAGIKYKNKDWNFDLSNTFGQNTFNYNVNNSNNASLGQKSPTNFNAGAHTFAQNTTNLDVNKKFNKFNLAFGSEFRYEYYAIKQGQEESWGTYDKFGSLINSSTNSEDIIGAGGSQSFIGFSPENALKKNRNSLAFYSNLSYDISFLTLDLATRYENYSDFGSSLNGKLAFRVEPIKNYSIRGSVSSGFRAPSLHQRYFNNTYSDISSTKKEIVNNGIFNNESLVAQKFNIPKLTEEKSTNFSAGLTFKPLNKLFITLDAYLINIKDRIVVTSIITGETENGDIIDENVYKTLQSLNVSGARFFVNAIDTRTKGIDLVVSYDTKIGSGNLNINLSANYNQTKIRDFNFPESLGTNQQIREQYFGPDQINIIESLSPKTKGTLGLNYKINKLNFFIRNTYFGEVIRDGRPARKVQEHNPKLVTDFSLGYDLTKRINLTIGANNIFDVFPDLQVYDNSYFGVFKYAPVQMGTTGSYYFARLNFNF